MFIFLSTFIIGATLTSVGSIESLVVSEMGLNHTLTGLLQTSFFIGNLLGSLMAGLFLTKRPAIKVGLFATIFMIAGNLCGVFHIYIIMLLGRFIGGLGASGIIIFCTAIIVNLYNKRQTGLLNLAHSSVALGAFAGLFGGRAISDTFNNWSFLYLILAFMSGIALLLLFMSKAEDFRGEESFDFSALYEMLTSRPVVISLLIVMTYVMAEQGIVVFYSTYIEGRLGIDPVSASRISALFWIGIMTGRLLTFAIGHRVSNQSLLFLCIVVGSTILLINMAATTKLMALICILLGGFFVGPVFPVTISYGVNEIGNKKSLFMSFSNFTACVGGGLGSLFVGKIGDEFSLMWGIVPVLLLFLISCIPLFIIRRLQYGDQ